VRRTALHQHTGLSGEKAEAKKLDKNRNANFPFLFDQTPRTFVIF